MKISLIKTCAALRENGPTTFIGETIKGPALVGGCLYFIRQML